MAIAAFLIGGVAGVLAFLASMMFFDFGFLAALGLYMGVGTAVSLASLCVAMLAQETRRKPAESPSTPVSA